VTIYLTLTGFLLASLGLLGFFLSPNTIAQLACGGLALAGVFFMVAALRIRPGK